MIQHDGNLLNGSEAINRLQRHFQAARMESSADALEKLIARFLRRVNRSGENECWEWTGSRSKKGYGRVEHHFNGRKTIPTHRLAYVIYVGQIPTGMHVLHSCDNPPCCNPNHLRTGTNLENVLDRVAHGKQQRGNVFLHAKLDAEKVKEIRAKYSWYKTTYKQLAEEYGISINVIRGVLKQTRWQHVT